VWEQTKPEKDGWRIEEGIWRSLNRRLQLGRHAMFGDRENPMPDHSPAVSANRELATKIVAAYVRRHQIGADQIGALISNVHEALTGLNKPEDEAAGPRIPAVPIRQSVRRDYVVCLECAWRGQMLRRHLSAAHGLGTEEYRLRWNLPWDHPMVAPAYSERRSGLAKQLGLGRGRQKSTASHGTSEPETTTAS
jgi:predicted transcriptional regulator